MLYLLCCRFRKQGMECQVPVRIPVSIDVDLTPFFTNQENTQRNGMRALLQHLDSENRRNHQGVGF